MMGRINNSLGGSHLFLLLALLPCGARSHVLQEIPQAFAPALPRRASFLGGWAVYTAGACPDQTTACALSQWCCPSNTVCSIVGLAGAAVCCPDQNNCATYAEAVPACANTSWSMYQFYLKTQLCCEPGQVGLTDGVCVDKGLAVPVTELASSAVQITGSVVSSSTAANSAGGGSSVVTTSPGSRSSAAATGTPAGGSSTPTTTPIGSASTSAGASGSGSSSSSGLSGGTIGGIVGGVVGGIIIISLLIYLAFYCGRKRSARGDYPSNNYVAPAMMQNAEMAPPGSQQYGVSPVVGNAQTAPPIPSNQSPYPQKYDGYGRGPAPIPTEQTNFAPNAPATYAEVGDNRPHAYDRAELGPST